MQQKEIQRGSLDEPYAIRVNPVIEYTALVVVVIKTGKETERQASTLKSEKVEKPRFKSKHSYYCHGTELKPWSECHKLIVDFMR